MFIKTINDDNFFSEAGEPEDKAYSGLVGNLPKIHLRAKDIKNLTPVQRLNKIGSLFYTSEVSAFVKGALMHKVIDYGAALFGGKQSPVGKIYLHALHSVVNMFELDAALHSVIHVTEDTETDDVYDASLHDKLVMGVLKTRFFDNENIKGWQWSGEHYINGDEQVATNDLLHFFQNTHDDIAKKNNFETLYREDFEEHKTRYSLFVFKLEDDTHAYMCTQSSGSYGTTSNSIFVKGTRYNNVAIDTLMGKLNRMARENFIKIVEPEKNIVELVERITRIVPRRKSFEVMPNVDVETIRVSITMAMAAKRKRVIALVGDPGLGKTLAVHHIVNSFPKVPTFMVTASALGETPSAANVRSIFNAVISLESILVLDDFEGFGLKEKNQVVNEFLQQLDGSSGFKGIAILIVNDPSLVRTEVMNRPGRVDEVYEVGYLKDPEHLKTIISAQFKDIVYDDSYLAAFTFMIANMFSVSRIIHAVQFMTEHYDVSGASLLIAAQRMKEFETTALKYSVRGRLQSSGEPSREDESSDNFLAGSNALPILVKGVATRKKSRNR